MKKRMMKLTALLLTLSLTAGCGKAVETVAEKTEVSTESVAENEDEKSEDDAAEEESIGTAFNVEALKMKYAGNESVEYTEPIYNLERDHAFVFENIPDEVYTYNEYDFFDVYYDSSLDEHMRVQLDIEKDYDNHTLTVSPAFAFTYDVNLGCVEEDTWGSRSKFYLVQNVDLQTGEALEKPLVTMFTIRNDMTAPTLKQSVADNGYYALEWNAIEGADYYEVYCFPYGLENATLELTTEDTSCDFSQSNTHKEYIESWKDYEGTEVEGAYKWGINQMLDVEAGYFVVAKSDDGKYSGMSNICKVKDIANQIPTGVTDGHGREYEGDSALDLPAYAEVEMLDGSLGEFLIEYHGAQVYHLTDGRIQVDASFKNLPINIWSMYLTGMDYELFMEQSSQLSARGDELATKSVVATEDINIPYLPENTEPEDEETPEPEAESKDEETPEPEAEPKDEEAPEEKPKVEETPEPKEEKEEVHVAADIEDTIFATSALGEWLAVNMLNHEEIIPLDGFNEASDSEHLSDVLLEAYNQNPLIGLLGNVNYDYKNNALLMEYKLSKEETEHMQTESLKKAAEIAAEIITEDMSDYEKEEAINRYLCENASYNDEIMSYISEDGTIDNDVTSEHANSFTPYGILCENVGVCESYAEAFLLIAKAAGLDAVIVTGKMENVNHEWNRVKIDDAWYSLDVTNNDRDILPNSYFNLPDELAGTVLMQSKDAIVDSAVSKYAADGMDNEYYVKEGRYAEDLSMASKLLVEGLSQENIATIRVDTETKQQDVESVVRDAVTEVGLEDGMYYYASGVLSLVKE